MNTLRNTVNLIGFIGKDPVITEFGDNNAVVRFSIATNDRRKNKNGEWEDSTIWHQVVAWSQLAKNVEKVLVKGTEVALEGKLVYNSYKDKEGVDRTSAEITLRSFDVLTKKENK